MTITNAEYLWRKREAEKKHWSRIKNDSVLHEEENKKPRLRYQANQEKKRIKKNQRGRKIYVDVNGGLLNRNISRRRKLSKFSLTVKSLQIEQIQFV